jgi:hypothetical protein
MNYDFTVNQKTYDTMTKLQDMFGTDNNEQVLRKALALASVANQHKSYNNKILLMHPNTGPAVLIDLDH